MATKLLLILSAALFCSGECVDVRPPRFGRIEIEAFSGIGERLTSPAVDLIEVGTKKSVKSKVHGSIGAGIPYGTYLVQAIAIARSRRG